MENSELITEALVYIKSDISKSDMCVDDVARHAGFSTDYFNRIFTAHTGFSVMEYVRFSRLKKAAVLLRKNDRDILDIALDVGYDAHESFSRAFKKQYGKSPSEYREYYRDKPMKYADIADDTTAARFAHEFPQFKQLDTADVIDCLLERDAKRYGINAVVMYDYNGTKFFTDNEADGDYIGIDEYQKGVLYADIISNSLERIAQYYKTICHFVPSICFESEADDAEILYVFRKYGIACTQVVREIRQYLYTGTVKVLPKAEDDLTVRPLSLSDISDIRKWAAAYGNDWKLEASLTQRDVYHNDPHDLPFGIYAGETLVGVCRTCIYESRGFRVGDIEGICMLDKYKKAQNCDYVYSCAINEILKREYLPFTNYIKKGKVDVCDFEPERFDFELVKTICSVK